jgi:hypothetical protein
LSLPNYTDTIAVYSVPRLIFSDTMFCATSAFGPIGVRIHNPERGVFWDQILTRAIEDVIADENVKYVLTVDFDTIFGSKSVIALRTLLDAHPNMDAICPMQLKRGTYEPLCCRYNDDGTHQATVPMTEFDTEIRRITSGHFGLTLFRASVFKQLKRPWFWAQPDPNGSWRDNRVDSDVWFWRKFDAQGFSLFMANKVRVGHVESVPVWPDDVLRPVHGAKPVEDGPVFGTTAAQGTVTPIGNGRAA